MKKAFITGIGGQDGSYLAEYLLELGYQVHGIVRRNSTPEHQQSRLDEVRLNENLHVYYGDLLDQSGLERMLRDIQPDEVYNIAAQSHVRISFEIPQFTTQTNALGVINMLEAVRNNCPNAKFYQASSSEMFGGANKEILNENSPFDPKSPYAASKVFAHNITKLYRESYGIFAVNGILFNHESPFRGETFVTRKITRAVGRIHHKLQTKLTLGNLEASRDWGFAGDYVRGMFLMLQHDVASDWVLATGETHTVSEFAQKAFSSLDLDWEKFVMTSDKYFRPNEVNYLLGNSSKAKKELGWNNELSFDDLVELMVNSDLKLAEREKVLIENNLLKPTWEYPSI